MQSSLPRDFVGGDLVRADLDSPVVFIQVEFIVEITVDIY